MTREMTQQWAQAVRFVTAPDSTALPIEINDVFNRDSDWFAYVPYEDVGATRSGITVAKRVINVVHTGAPDVPRPLEPEEIPTRWRHSVITRLDAVSPLVMRMSHLYRVNLIALTENDDQRTMFVFPNMRLEPYDDAGSLPMTVEWRLETDEPSSDGKIIVELL